MDQENTSNGADMPGIANRLAQATQSLADALSNLDGQFTALHAKIDRIVAAVDDGDLKAQSAVARRKTISPMVSALLAKEGVEGDALVEAPVIEKALAGLSIEQRIAVKAELARAGILL